MLAQIILQAEPVHYTEFYEKSVLNSFASLEVLAEFSRSPCSSFVLFLLLAHYLQLITSIQ